MKVNVSFKLVKLLDIFSIIQKLIYHKNIKHFKTFVLLLSYSQVNEWERKINYNYFFLYLLLKLSTQHYWKYEDWIKNNIAQLSWYKLHITITLINIVIKYEKLKSS